MPAFRVLAYDIDGKPDPARADVLMQRGDEWHVVARCHGLDAETRAEDLRRQLELGLVALVVVEQGAHPPSRAWVPLGEAAVRLGARLRELVRLIGDGTLRAYDTRTGPHVHAADVDAVLEARAHEQRARSPAG